MINRSNRTFDTRCWQLAKVFILDDEELMKNPADEVDRLTNELAAEIQTVIENFIHEQKDIPF